MTEDRNVQLGLVEVIMRLQQWHVSVTVKVINSASSDSNGVWFAVGWRRVISRVPAADEACANAYTSAT